MEAILLFKRRPPLCQTGKSRIRSHVFSLRLWIYREKHKLTVRDRRKLRLQATCKPFGKKKGMLNTNKGFSENFNLL